LLDDGLSCQQVARVLLLDDDTIRHWHGAFAQGGRKALMRFEVGGNACVLTEAHQERYRGGEARRSRALGRPSDASSAARPREPTRPASPV